MWAVLIPRVCLILWVFIGLEFLDPSLLTSGKLPAEVFQIALCLQTNKMDTCSLQKQKIWFELFVKPHILKVDINPLVFSQIIFIIKNMDQNTTFEIFFEKLRYDIKDYLMKFNKLARVHWSSWICMKYLPLDTK